MELVRCCACAGLLRDPIQLPCRHNVCASCVDTIAATELFFSQSRRSKPALSTQSPAQSPSSSAAASTAAAPSGATRPPSASLNSGVGAVSGSPGTTASASASSSSSCGASPPFVELCCPLGCTAKAKIQCSGPGTGKSCVEVLTGTGLVRNEAAQAAVEKHKASLDVRFNPPCEVGGCLDDSQNGKCAPATLQCRQCRMMLFCAKCFALQHSTSNYLRSHKGTPYQPEPHVDYCLPRHPTKELEIFCQTFKKPICSLCHISAEHQGHSHLPLYDIVEAQKTEIQEMCKSLETFCGSCKSFMSELSSDKINAKAEQKLAEIKFFIASIQQEMSESLAFQQRTLSLLSNQAESILTVASDSVKSGDMVDLVHVHNVMKSFLLATSNYEALFTPLGDTKALDKLSAVSLSGDTTKQLRKLLLQVSLEPNKTSELPPSPETGTVNDINIMADFRVLCSQPVGMPSVKLLLQNPVIPVSYTHRSIPQSTLPQPPSKHPRFFVCDFDFTKGKPFPELPVELAPIVEVAANSPQTTHRIWLHLPPGRNSAFFLAFGEKFGSSGLNAPPGFGAMRAPVLGSFLLAFIGTLCAATFAGSRISEYGGIISYITRLACHASIHNIGLLYEGVQLTLHSFEPCTYAKAFVTVLVAAGSDTESMMQLLEPTLESDLEELGRLAFERELMQRLEEEQAPVEKEEHIQQAAPPRKNPARRARRL
ncbi:hypothetical protein Pelo_16846 [Pelomyxa schiedti]|nr:hypothetical protein Pelo_16846 [Pelomyxa schiedti]